MPAQAVGTLKDMLLLSMSDVLFSSDPTTTFTVLPGIIQSAVGGVFCNMRGKGALQDRAELAPVDCWRGKGAHEVPELAHMLYF